MNILVFDTETTNLQKPFCYNVGYTIFDTVNFEHLINHDFVIEQVWHNLELFSTAYYAEKRPLYINRMRGRRATMDKFGYIMQTMAREIKQYGVTDAFAYNSKFDDKVFQWNCDWFHCINPLDNVAIHDIRGHVMDSIAFTDDFQTFCDNYELYTDTGNYSTTAETVYKYITDSIDFEEEHTALSDSLIETNILVNCVTMRGCEWVHDYPIPMQVSRNVKKEFTIIDANQIEHTFDYTNKRKLRDREGFQLFNREN